jgi:hypothetical protein
MRFRKERYGRFWAVYEYDTLICVTVYKKGAIALIRRLAKGDAAIQSEPAQATPLPAIH